MIAMGLVAPVVPLQFDVGAGGEEAGQPLQHLLARGHAAAAESMRQRAFVAAREAAQAGRVWLDELPREACLSLGPILGAGSQGLAEVLVGFAILHEDAD